MMILIAVQFTTTILKAFAKLVDNLMVDIMYSLLLSHIIS